MQSTSRIRRRLNESKWRSELRARPRLQGRILAPAGLRHRLPSAAGLYFPFYHDVPAEYAGDLRRHLLAYRRIGTMLTWDEGLEVLAGRRPMTGPMFVLNFDDGHRSWRDVLVPMLIELDIPATFFVATGLIEQPGNLTWRDCRDLAATGFGIGSHTLTHRRLADLDEAEATREIRESREILAERTGTEVRDFAAPYGHPAVDFSERDVRIAELAGYRSFASTARPAMRAGDSPMWINRQGLHPAWPLWAVRTRVHD